MLGMFVFVLFLICFLFCDGDIAILGAGQRKGVDDALIKSLSFGINTSNRITVLNGTGISIQTELFEMRNVDESLKISPSRLEYSAENLLWESSYYGQSWTLSLNRTPLLKVFKSDAPPRINSIEVIGHGIFQDILLSHNNNLEKLIVSLCSLTFPTDPAKSTICINNIVTQKGSILSLFEAVMNTISYHSKSLQKSQEDNLIMFVQLPKTSDLLVINKTIESLNLNVSSNHLLLLSLLEECNKTQNVIQNTLNISIDSLSQNMTNISQNLSNTISTVNQTLLENINNRTVQLDARINDTMKLLTSNLTQIQHTTNTSLYNITNILIPSFQKENDKQFLTIFETIHHGLQNTSKNFSQIYDEIRSNFTIYSTVFQTSLNTTHSTLSKELSELATNQSIANTLLKYEFNTTLEKISNKMELQHTLLVNNQLDSNISVSKSLTDLSKNISSVNDSLLSLQSDITSNLSSLNSSLSNYTTSLLANISDNKQMMNQMFLNTSKEINSTEVRLRYELHEFQNNASSAIARSNAILSKVIADINVTITTTNDDISKNISDLSTRMHDQLHSLSELTYSNLTDKYSYLTASVVGNREALNSSILKLATATWENITTLHNDTLSLISNTSNAIAAEANARRLSLDSLSSQLRDHREAFENTTARLLLDTTANLTTLQQLTAQSISDTTVNLTTSLQALSQQNNHTSTLLAANISNLSLTLVAVNTSLSNSINDSTASLRANLTSYITSQFSDTNHTIVTVNSTLSHSINQTVESFQRANTDLWNRTETAVNNSNLLRDQLQQLVLTRIDQNSNDVNTTIIKLENTTLNSLIKLNDTFTHLLHLLNDSTQSSFLTHQHTLNSSLQSLLAADRQMQEENKKEFSDLKYDLLTLEVMSYNNIQQVANQSVTALQLLENSTTSKISKLNDHIVDLISGHKNLSEAADGKLWTTVNKTIEDLNTTFSTLLLTNSSLFTLLTTHQNNTASNITSLSSQLNDNFTSLSTSISDLRKDVNSTDTSFLKELQLLNALFDRHVTNTSQSLSAVNSSLAAVNTTISEWKNKMTVDQTIMKHELLQTVTDTNNTFHDKLAAINKTFTDMALADRIHLEAKILSTHIQLEEKQSDLNTTLLALNQSLENKITTLHYDQTNYKEGMKIELEKQTKERLSVESTLSQNILELRSDLVNTSRALQDTNASVHQLASGLGHHLARVNLSLWDHILLAESHHSMEMALMQTDQASTRDCVTSLEQGAAVLTGNMSTMKSDLSATTDRVAAIESKQVTIKDDLTYLTFNVSLLSKDLNQTTVAQVKTHSELSSLLQSELPTLRLEVMKLTERQDAANVLSDSRYNASLQTTRQLEAERNSLVTSMLHFAANVTEKVTHTIAAQNQSSLELSSLRASTQGELRKVHEDMTSLSAKQAAEKTAIESLGKEINSSTALFLSIKSDVEVVHAVKESVSNLKETFSQQISELREKQLASEKLLSELSGRVHLLELNGLASEKRLALLEGERERGMREYATSSELDSVRKLINELQMNMLVHSGKVLDLVTAAHLAPSKTNP